MEYISKTMSGAELNNIFEIPPALLNKMVRIIILPAEDTIPETSQPRKRQLGFLKGKVPPLPDSFFDPLPEEDLQAWGL